MNWVPVSLGRFANRRRLWLQDTHEIDAGRALWCEARIVRSPKRNVRRRCSLKTRKIVMGTRATVLDVTWLVYHFRCFWYRVALLFSRSSRKSMGKAVPCYAREHFGQPSWYSRVVPFLLWGQGVELFDQLVVDTGSQPFGLEFHFGCLCWSIYTVESSYRMRLQHE